MNLDDLLEDSKACSMVLDEKRILKGINVQHGSQKLETEWLIGFSPSGSFYAAFLIKWEETDDGAIVSLSIDEGALIDKAGNPIEAWNWNFPYSCKSL